MRRCSTRSGHRPSVRIPLVVLLSVAFGSAGCVSLGKHRETVDGLESENTRLEKHVADLERSNKSLDAERVELLDQVEDLRVEHEGLTADIAKLERTRELLTEHLRERDAQVTELSRLKGTYEGLVSDLESEVSAGQIQIEQLRDGIRMNLSQDILFPSGSVQLNPSGAAVLRKVAGQLREIEHRVEVQGHSDDVPVSANLSRRFPSNWELAGARASSVVRLLEKEGVDPHRLASVSHGEWAPVASNDTAEGRAYNRRIEIRLVPMDAPVAMEEEPAPSRDAPAAAASGP